MSSGTGQSGSTGIKQSSPGTQPGMLSPTARGNDYGFSPMQQASSPVMGYQQFGLQQGQRDQLGRAIGYQGSFGGGRFGDWRAQNPMQNNIMNAAMQYFQQGTPFDNILRYAGGGSLTSPANPPQALPQSPTVPQPIGTTFTASAPNEGLLTKLPADPVQQPSVLTRPPEPTTTMFGPGGVASNPKEALQAIAQAGEQPTTSMFGPNGIPANPRAGLNAAMIENLGPAATDLRGFQSVGMQKAMRDQLARSLGFKGDFGGGGFSEWRSQNPLQNYRFNMALDRFKEGLPDSEVFDVINFVP